MPRAECLTLAPSTERLDTSVKMVTWLQRYGRNSDGHGAQTMTTDPSVLRHGEDTPTAAGPTWTASVSWGSKTLTEVT